MGSLSKAKQDANDEVLHHYDSCRRFLCHGLQFTVIPGVRRAETETGCSESIICHEETRSKIQNEWPQTDQANPPSQNRQIKSRLHSLASNFYMHDPQVSVWSLLAGGEPQKHDCNSEITLTRPSSVEVHPLIRRLRLQTLYPVSGSIRKITSQEYNR